jgi:hypothetical protein
MKEALMGWLNLPLQIALGIALAGLMTRLLHLLGLS